MLQNKNTNIKISIIGLGYVGLPLALEFGKHFLTIGYDINIKRISDLSKNIDTNNETSLKKEKSKYLKFSNKISAINNSDFYIITLPTPINSKNIPDTRIIKSTLKKISKNLNKDAIIILESTVYPGFTEEICAPIIEKYSKLKFNKDFFLGYSPERINPGDQKHQLKNITKIISASNKKSLDKIEKIYSKIIKPKLFKAETIRIAEAAKVIENTQRDLNIAFINELSLIFNKLNIDTYKVLEAASTKWNFLNFKPGLVGGHCIGVDPYYLTYKAKSVGLKTKIILAGRKLNDDMHKHIAKIFLKKMKNNGIKANLSKILVMGVTFKENCSDIRNTKVSKLINYLSNKVKILHAYDPLVDKKIFNDTFSIKLINKPKLNFYNSIIIAVPHKIFKNADIYNFDKYLIKKGIIFDVKGDFKKNKNFLTL